MSSLNTTLLTSAPARSSSASFRASGLSAFEPSPGVKEMLCRIPRPAVDWTLCKVRTPGEAEAGSAGTQPRQGIIRWAHRADENESVGLTPRFSSSDDSPMP